MKQYIVDRHTDPSNPTLVPVPSERIPVYDTKAEMESDLANLGENEFVMTKDTGEELSDPVNVVESGNLNAVTSNAVAQKFGNLVYFKVRNTTKKTPNDRAYFTITDFFPNILNNYVLVAGHGTCNIGSFVVNDTTSSSVDTSFSNLIALTGTGLQANTTYSSINFDIFAIEIGLFTEQ